MCACLMSIQSLHLGWSGRQLKLALPQRPPQLPLLVPAPGQQRPLQQAQQNDAGCGASGGQVLVGSAAFGRPARWEAGAARGAVTSCSRGVGGGLSPLRSPQSWCSGPLPPPLLIPAGPGSRLARADPWWSGCPAHPAGATQQQQCSGGVAAARDGVGQPAGMRSRCRRRRQAVTREIAVLLT
jgi:hypothetical protein